MKPFQTMASKPSPTMARSYTISISRARTTLLPHQIAALASEFCGLVKGSDAPEEVDCYIVAFSVKANGDAFTAAVSGFAPVPPQ